MSKAQHSAPYTRAPGSVGHSMAQVLLALAPACLFGVYLYGWPALNLLLVTIASALLAEALCLRWAGKPLRRYLFDGSALLTACLLAMSLPPWAPGWIGVCGAFFAIVIGKQVFGGLGQNLFNPAMVARVVLLIAFPLEMTQFITPTPMFSPQAPDFMQGLAITFGGGSVDAYSGATLLGHAKTELSRNVPMDSALAAVYQPMDAALGFIPGSLGETSAVLLLLGGVYLLIKRVISWHIPVSMLGSLMLLSALFHWLEPTQYAAPGVHLLSAATLLGAFFIATDLVTSPVTARGQLLFGVGCGVLVFVIRNWAGYPEGMGFAVLLMNACTPLIDHYLRPRVYGRDRKGEPLSYGDKPESSS